MDNEQECLVFEECKHCPSGINCCICTPPPLLLTKKESMYFPKDIQKLHEGTGYYQLKIYGDKCLFFKEGSGCCLPEHERPMECRLFPVIPYGSRKILLSYRCLAVRNILFDEERFSKLLKRAKMLMESAPYDWIDAMNKVFKFDDFKIKLLIDLNKE